MYFFIILAAALIIIGIAVNVSNFSESADDRKRKKFKNNVETNDNSDFFMYNHIMSEQHGEDCDYNSDLGGCDCSHDIGDNCDCGCDAGGGDCGCGGGD